MYKKSESSPIACYFDPLHLSKTFEYFRDMKQEQFFDRIRSAQVIYQSYLYDYQRIGVFLFLLQLVVLGFTWYRINQDFVPHNKESLQPEQSSNTKAEAKSDEKSPKAEDHAVAVAFIVVLALLFPLMREIKAQNIDPQKKFWMLNLSNWYAPGFVFPDLPPVKGIEEEKKNEPVSNSQFDNSIFNIFNENTSSLPDSSIDENDKDDTSEVPDLVKLQGDINKIKKQIVNED
jgi:hypothetical protein